MNFHSSPGKIIFTLDLDIWKNLMSAQEIVVMDDLMACSKDKGSRLTILTQDRKTMNRKCLGTNKIHIGSFKNHS
jgi:hypothetical protein